MLTETPTNPLLDHAINADQAVNNPAVHHAERGDSHDSHVLADRAYHAAPTNAWELLLATLTNVDWLRVYQTAVATTAGLSAVFCAASTIKLAGSVSNGTEYLIMAAHDLPLVGVALALAYSAIVFQRNTLFATIATAGAIVSALVSGGAA